MQLIITENKMDKRFAEIVKLIKQSRTNAIKALNFELINLILVNRRTFM